MKRLKDICEFIVDCPHSTAKDEGAGYPLIRTPNIGKGRFNLEGVHRVSENVYRQRNLRATPQDDDLIFAREAPAGNVAIIKNGEKFCLGQRTVLIRPNPQYVSPDFLTYFLLAPQQQYKLLGTANGATVPHINLPTIRELEINIPPIEIQRRIADILSAYDNLIENNRKQIKLLEEAAQRLYKEWFIDLRFPGHEHTKIVDGVPEGWDKTPLGKLVTYEIGGGWGEDLVVGQNDCPSFVIRGTDIDGIKQGNFLSIPYRFHTQGNLASRKLQDGDIIFEVSGGSKNTGVAKTLLMTKRLLGVWPKPVMCASFCKLMRFENPQIAQYIYDCLQYWRIVGKTQEYEKKSASSIINYRWKDFLGQKHVLIPEQGLLQQYYAMNSSLYEQAIICAIAISKATQARDRLLPKLMNGEIEI